MNSLLCNPVGTKARLRPVVNHLHSAIDTSGVFLVHFVSFRVPARGLCQYFFEEDSLMISPSSAGFSGFLHSGSSES